MGKQPAIEGGQDTLPPSLPSRHLTFRKVQLKYRVLNAAFPSTHSNWGEQSLHADSCNPSFCLVYVAALVFLSWVHHAEMNFNFREDKGSVLFPQSDLPCTY